jgi:AraC family transcriptional regulator
MILHIKNMVCDRCIMVVDQQLKALGFTVAQSELGHVTVAEEPDAAGLSKIRSALKLLGFELLDEKRSQMISPSKNISLPRK